MIELATTIAQTSTPPPDLQQAMDQVAAGATGLLIGMIVFYVILLIVMVDCWGRISKKTGNPYIYGLLIILIPIVNCLLLAKIAGKSPLFGLLLFIPFVNIIAAGSIMGNIAVKRGKSFWLYAVGVFVPLLNLILILNLGYSK